MKNVFETTGPHNCLGCYALCEDICMDDFACIGDTPPAPACYQYPPEFIEAVNKCRQLRDALGPDNVATQAAQLAWMQIAPPPLRARLTKTAVEIGLIPPPYGYTESGLPLFRYDEVAEALGLGPTEAEAILQEGYADSAAQCSSDFDPHVAHLRQ